MEQPPKRTLADCCKIMSEAIPDLTIQPSAVLVYEDRIGNYPLIFIRCDFILRDDSPALHVQMSIPATITNDEAHTFVAVYFNHAIEKGVDGDVPFYADKLPYGDLP